MPKLRRLGPGSWFVSGQNTLHIAHATYGPVDVDRYLDGHVLPVERPARPAWPGDWILNTGSTSAVTLTGMRIQYR